MAYIVAVGTSVPPYPMNQREVRDFSRNLFARSLPEIDRLLPVFENTGIDRRYFSKPRAWFEKDHTFEEKNQAFVEMACRLGKEAIEQCLSRSGVSVHEIDHLIFVSTTGLATPSIDAHLIQQLGMKPHVHRTPIWGLGCAGGVVGLARAYDVAQADPSRKVLMVAVECCSLTFRRKDLSKRNLVATSLFADGAAAVLVVGDQVMENQSFAGPEIVGSMSTIFPSSLDVMGWEVAEDGLQVVFSKDIPSIVRKHINPLVRKFVDQQQIRFHEIEAYITHPGGRKVLEAYQDSLALRKEHLQYSYQVLKRYGNMSSATVLFVLKEELEQSHAFGRYGLVSALGPGFSAELLLLRWGEKAATDWPDRSKDEMMVND